MRPRTTWSLEQSEELGALRWIGGSDCLPVEVVSGRVAVARGVRSTWCNVGTMEKSKEIFRVGIVRNPACSPERDFAVADHREQPGEIHLLQLDTGRRVLPIVPEQPRQLKVFASLC